MLSALARLIVRRARLVLVLALIVVVISGALAAGVFSRLGTAGYDDPNSASSQAQRLVNQNFGGQPDLVFLVRSMHGTVDETAAKASGQALTQRLSHDPSCRGSLRTSRHRPCRCVLAMLPSAGAGPRHRSGQGH